MEKSYGQLTNVRELKNIIERAIILGTGSTLRIDLKSAGEQDTTVVGKTLG